MFRESMGLTMSAFTFGLRAALQRQYAESHVQRTFVSHDQIVTLLTPGQGLRFLLQGGFSVVGR